MNTVSPDSLSSAPRDSVDRHTLLKEELMKKELDQLHGTVLEFSKTCLEMKKLCVTALAAVAGVILGVTDNRLDASLWIAALLAVFVFWMADAQAYFYQEKVRRRMTEVASSLLPVGERLEGFGMLLGKRLAHPRTCGARIMAVMRAGLNPSQVLYLLAAALITFVAYLDASGMFGVGHR